MENEKTPLYVAFSTQKGGVGKTTFTVLAASYLYYLKGYDVVVVDCDYPQHSIAGMRKRDAEMVGEDEDYKRMAYEQFTRLGKKAYPVLCSSPEKAIATADEYLFRPTRNGKQRGCNKLPVRYGLYFHPHSRRQSSAGKQPVVCGGYQQATGTERSLPPCRAIPFLEHGGRQRKDRLVHRV